MISRQSAHSVSKYKKDSVIFIKNDLNLFKLISNVVKMIYIHD